MFGGLLLAFLALRHAAQCRVGMLHPVQEPAGNRKLSRVGDTGKCVKIIPVLVDRPWHRDRNAPDGLADALTAFASATG